MISEIRPEATTPGDSSAQGGGYVARESSGGNFLKQIVKKWFSKGPYMKHVNEPEPEHLRGRAAAGSAEEPVATNKEGPSATQSPIASEEDFLSLDLITFPKDPTKSQ